MPGYVALASRPTFTLCPLLNTTQEASRVTEFPCLSNTGRIPKVLPWGDPKHRQLPLWMRWEQFAHGRLPSDLRQVRFVQIGAKCGKNTKSCAVLGDPIWSYATMCGWTGLTIEPSYYNFEQLCHNYRRWPAVTPVRTAVSNQSGEGTLLLDLRFGEMNRLVSGPSSSQSLRPNESVPVSTLMQLWEWWAPSRVDILVVDAEGHESVILGHQPIPSPRPALILFEHIHMRPAAQEQVQAALRQQGYAWLGDFGSNAKKPENRLFGRHAT